MMMMMLMMLMQMMMMIICVWLVTPGRLCHMLPWGARVTWHPGQSKAKERSDANEIFMVRIRVGGEEHIPRAQGETERAFEDLTPLPR